MSGFSGGGSGTGNVTGPGTSTDNAVARFDGTGNTIQNSGFVVADTTGEPTFTGSAWDGTYAPVVTASTGTFTTVSATGKFKQYGKQISYYVAVVCTTVGTAAGRLIVTLPTATTGGGSGLATGINSGTLKNVSGIVEYDANGKLSCVYYDGTFPITSSQTVYLAGVYEAA